MQKKKKTLYEFLGIEPDATSEEIKAAAQRLGKKFHPSKYPGNAKVANRFKKIKIVYNTLANPSKRAIYDAALAKKWGPNLGSSESVSKNSPSTHIPKTIQTQTLLKIQVPDLHEGEQILYQAYLHWFSYLKALLIIGITTYLWLEPSILKIDINEIVFFQDQWRYINIGLLVILCLGFFLFLTTLLKQFTTTLILTTERTIFGFFMQKPIEITHLQFEQIKIRQSVLGTWFRFGHLTIQGNKGQKVIRIANVAAPQRFEKQLMQLIN